MLYLTIVYERRQTTYERELTFSTWPAKKYMLSTRLAGMSGTLEYSKQK